MSKVDYTYLRTVIDDFGMEYPRPILILSIEELSPIITNGMWQNADKAGLYFLFDETENLMYIGKASFGSSIGYRIGAKFSSKDCRCLDPKFSSATLLATLPLPEDRVFEASSIEEFLIGKLKPPLNVIGV